MFMGLGLRSGRIMKRRRLSLSTQNKLRSVENSPIPTIATFNPKMAFSARLLSRSSRQVRSCSAFLSNTGSVCEMLVFYSLIVSEMIDFVVWLICWFFSSGRFVLGEMFSDRSMLFRCVLLPPKDLALLRHPAQRPRVITAIRPLLPPPRVMVSPISFCSSSRDGCLCFISVFTLKWSVWLLKAFFQFS